MNHYIFSFGEARFFDDYVVIRPDCSIVPELEHIQEFGLACKQVFDGRPYTAICDCQGSMSSSDEFYDYLHHQTDMIGHAFVCHEAHICDQLRKVSADGSFPVKVYSDMDSAVAWAKDQAAKALMAK